MSVYEYKTLAVTASYSSSITGAPKHLCLFTVPSGKQWIIKTSMITQSSASPSINLIHTTGIDIKGTIAKWVYGSGGGNFQTSGDVPVSIGPGNTNPNIVPGTIFVTNDSSYAQYCPILINVLNDGAGSTDCVAMYIGTGGSVSVNLAIDSMYLGSALRTAVSPAANIATDLELSGYVFGPNDKLWLFGSGYANASFIFTGLEITN